MMGDWRWATDLDVSLSGSLGDHFGDNIVARDDAALEWLGVTGVIDSGESRRYYLASQIE